MPFLVSLPSGDSSLAVAEVGGRIAFAVRCLLRYRPDTISMAPKQPITVVIVGAGLSGITLGIELQRRGIQSFKLYEKDAENIGGTWRDNTYPNCACDVPSHCELYPGLLYPPFSIARR